MKYIKNKQFTLVELLVVISIITILASLLLPSLRKAKESAHQVACRNNLKQLSVGTSFYWEDYQGYNILWQWFGMGTADSPGSYKGGWTTYIPSQIEYFKTLQDSGVFLCPSQNSSTLVTNYGRNQFCGDGYYTQRIGLVDRWPKKYDFSGKTSEVFEYACHDGPRVTYWYDNDKLVPQHNGGKTTIVNYYDGHVDWTTYEEMYSVSATSLPWQP